jgi:hypothetical protein
MVGLRPVGGRRPAVSTIGHYMAPLYLVVVIHMVLAFPTGRLEEPGHRAIVLAA